MFIDFLGGGNSNMFGIFTPKIGEDEPILTNSYFSDGLVQPPTSFVTCFNKQILMNAHLWQVKAKVGALERCNQPARMDDAAADVFGMSHGDPPEI